MFNAGGGVMLGNEGSRVAAQRYRHPREKRGPGGWLKSLRPWIPAFRGNDGRADHRGLDALASAEQVDRPLFRPGASFCGKSRARSAATRITAPPPSVTRQHCNKRNGLAIISELSASSMVIGVLRVARVLGRPLALHDRDRRHLLVLVVPAKAGTTLFRCVTRLAQSDGGQIFLGEHAIRTLGGRQLSMARSEIGLIFQQFNLIRRLNALDNVLVGRLGEVATWRVMLRRFPRSDRQLALAALDRVGMLPYAL
jgi:hypothetical protein